MPGIRLYPASYTRQPQEAQPSRPGFLLPSGCRHSFLEPSCPAQGLFLSHDRPTHHRTQCRDLDGVSMFRTNEIRVGSDAPFTPGLRCSHSRRKRISCHCRSSATSPTLRSFSCLPELRVTKPHQGFTLVHPSTLPLACDPRTRQGLLGFSPRLRTPQLPVTHARAGTGIEHLPELRSRPIPTSYPRNPLASCELTSHILGPVVQILRLPVLDRTQNPSARRVVAAQFVGDQHPGHVLQSRQQLAKEPGRRLGVPPGSHQVHCPPQVVRLAVDRDEHLVEVPCVPWAGPASA